MNVTHLRPFAFLALLAVPVFGFAAPPETKKIEVVAHKYAFEPSRIEVRVANSTWGPLFGYRGWFETRWEPLGAEGVPDDVKPAREEGRE